MGSKSKLLAPEFVFREPSIERPQKWKGLFGAVSFSFIVHAILLFILSWIVFQLPHPGLDTILSMVLGDNEPIADKLVVEFPQDEQQPQQAASKAPSDGHDSGTALGFQSAFDLLRSPNSAQQSEFPISRLVNGRLFGGQVHGDHFTGRSLDARKALVSQRGGTAASEAAVGRGLEWLKRHQNRNGSWSFAFKCDCGDRGSSQSDLVAATGLALLSFLGAGHTHLEGDYQDEVKRGLYFLKNRATKASRIVSKTSYKGLCLRDQSHSWMYGHGMATIALSEAFAMTHDAELRPTIAGAVEYLVSSQGPDGGWRYQPPEPGDLSVVGWELMALKSAQFSRVTVPAEVFHGVDKFLNSVAMEGKLRYQYMANGNPKANQSMTAIGLLCRMYLDWDTDDGSLQAGIRYLDELGPERGHMYSNFYGTQVMYHWGGAEWDRWNEVMRERLVSTQKQALGRHNDGSWDPDDTFGPVGGRLYMTTLALLTLEVYYRHLPLYQRDRMEIPLMSPKNKSAAR